MLAEFCKLGWMCGQSAGRNILQHICSQMDYVSKNRKIYEKRSWLSRICQILNIFLPFSCQKVNFPFYFLQHIHPWWMVRERGRHKIVAKILLHFYLSSAQTFCNDGETKRGASPRHWIRFCESKGSKWNSTLGIRLSAQFFSWNALSNSDETLPFWKLPLPSRPLDQRRQMRAKLKKVPGIFRHRVLLTLGHFNTGS